MPKFGFAIDNRACIGCHACTVACKSEHEVPIGVNRTWVKYIEKGTFPDTTRMFSVQRCNHCADAPCVDICPTTSLYTRPDGIVDFDSDRCIGCKSCMQACPYDALYIDPATLTAAKCNYCTHRVDHGYEPACVVVCPTEAIVSGDLDDPQSRISRLDRTLHVQYPKVEKGTNPKLFYVGGETAAMDPAAAGPSAEYLWSASSGVTRSTLAAAEDEAGAEAARARRVYDVHPKGTQWGMKVSAYITTKAISVGVVAVAFLSAMLGATDIVLPGWAALLSLLFLGITGVLLVADLKQPARFHYVLLRPQWKSWLVRGAYLILLFSMLVPLTWLVSTTSDSRTTALIFGGVTSAVGICVACYTALLLAQAKGRDYWQNPLLVFSMGADALVAGAAVLTLVGEFVPDPGQWLGVGAALLGVLLAAEFAVVHQTKNAARAAKLMTSGPYRREFWGGVVVLGILSPLVIAVGGGSEVLTSLLLLFGIAVKGHLLIQAPQQVPLS